MTITVMERQELKYLLSGEQTAFFRERIKERVKADQYGKITVASLYYDTPSYQLIRASLEKPVFKEKIRLRSYGLATETSPVFLELKRKSCETVYKRRIETTVTQAERFFSGDGNISAEGQISREITAFRDYYKTLVPTCLIICDRTAFYAPGGNLRLTIDENPRYRSSDLTLTKSMEGTSLLKDGMTILEIKVRDAVPLWLAAVLSEGGIYKSSFSKYGEAYRNQFYYLNNMNTRA